MAFCPKCGKKGIKGTFCSECAEQELGLEFKDITIKKCIECDRFMIRHKWQIFRSPDEGIIHAAYTRIKNLKSAVLDITPRYKELKDKPGAEQDIELEISAGGQEFIIPAKIQFTYCDKCAKKDTEYFEGVLQIRGATPELTVFVRTDIAANEDRGVHLTKESGSGADLDFQMTSAKYIRALGKKLKQNFNGELHETSKLFSKNRQTGKEIHRISVLFRMRGHRIGDIVESKGRQVKITTLGKKASGIDIKTGKKVFVE
ncbi:hypothetical protein JW898_05655 [Candidatus Woesearchaeota archaeon]|nr:hypothetical protein [Candidatus Woesearchaeota archaeon]